jgi:hypothetical protein
MGLLERRTRWGETALHLAATAGAEKAVQVWGMQGRFSCWVICENLWDVVLISSYVEMLVSFFFDSNHFQTEHSPCTQVLLDAGADVEAEDVWQRTAVTVAVQQGKQAVVQAFRARGHSPPPLPITTGMCS